MSERKWNYLFGTASEAPPEVRWSTSGVDVDQLRFFIGIYCGQESHIREPWLIGSFCVSREVLEERGEIWWGLRKDFPTGDGSLLRVGGQQSQLIAGSERVPTDNDGLPILSTEAHRQGRGRERLQCRRCGLTVTLRSETVQKIAARLFQAGMREVTLSQLQEGAARLA